MMTSHIVQTEVSCNGTAALLFSVPPWAPGRRVSPQAHSDLRAFALHLPSTRKALSQRVSMSCPRFICASNQAPPLPTHTLLLTPLWFLYNLPSPNTQGTELNTCSLYVSSPGHKLRAKRVGWTSLLQILSTCIAPGI